MTEENLIKRRLLFEIHPVCIPLFPSLQASCLPTRCGARYTAHMNTTKLFHFEICQLDWRPAG